MEFHPIHCSLIKMNMKFWSGVLWTVFSTLGFVLSFYVIMRGTLSNDRGLGYYLFDCHYWLPLGYFGLGMIFGYGLMRSHHLIYAFAVMISVSIMILYTSFFVIVVRTWWGVGIFSAACGGLILSLAVGIMIIADEAKKNQSEQDVASNL